MLIDALAPNPAAVETHWIEIAAPPDAIYRALGTNGSGQVSGGQALLALRSLPAWIRTGHDRSPRV
jgi:hypothetical protein